MTQMETVPPGYVFCAECKTTAFRPYRPQHIYCKHCSREREKEYKADHARENRDPAKSRAATKRGRDKKNRNRRKQGPERSAAAPQRQLMIPDGLAWSSVISMVFTYDGSKNAIWRTNDRGHIFNREASNNYRDSIAEMIALQVGQDEHEFRHGRVVVGLLARKPDHRGDAINFVDLVADAIEDASGIDDRWYQCAGVDWQVVRHNAGSLEIVVGQPLLEERFLCSSCGVEQGRDGFHKNSSTKHGVSRYCKGCVRDSADERTDEETS